MLTVRERSCLSQRARRSLRRVALVRFGARASVLWRERSAARRRPRDAARYLLRGREIANFTYELANQDDAVTFIADALGSPRPRVQRYARELHDDDDLRSRLAAGLRTRPDRERTPRYGKRTLYYCIVRCEQPDVVVETGTHDGLGAAVLARALERNAAEGHPGELLTFDVNPGAGWLLDAAMRRWTQCHVGDTRLTLPRALECRRVDVFLHDSLKTREHETLEFNIALRRGAARLVLITDDARATGTLGELSSLHGGRYMTFRERPWRHFWPGNEIGIAVIETYGRPAGSTPT